MCKPLSAALTALRSQLGSASGGAGCSPCTHQPGEGGERNAAAGRTFWQGIGFREVILPMQTGTQICWVLWSGPVQPFLCGPEQAQCFVPPHDWCTPPCWGWHLLSGNLKFQTCWQLLFLSFFFFLRKRITFREKDIKIKLKIKLAQKTDSSWCLLNNPSAAVCILLLIKAIWILWKEQSFLTKPIITLSHWQKKKKKASLPSPSQESRKPDSFTAYFLRAIQRQEELFTSPSHSPLLPLPFYPRSDGVAPFEHVKATPGEPFSTFVCTPLTQCMLADGGS